MIRSLILSTIVGLSLHASEYYAKAEPVERYTIQSSVAGKVLFADENIEGRRATAKEIILIDDEIDVKELSSVSNKIKIVEKMVELNQATASNLQKIAEKKKINYQKILKLKTKSLLDKDREFYDLSSTQNTLYQSLQSVETLKLQLEDLKVRERTLQKSIREKRVSYPSFVVYKLLVKKGQNVMPGTPLLEIADVSHSRLVLFLHSEEAKNVSKKIIYIDGKKTEYKVDKLYFISDAQRISSYKTEIVIDAPDTFSKLLKVEFKD